MLNLAQSPPTQFAVPLPKCPACDRPAKYLRSRTVDIFRCDECGLVFAEASGAVVDTPYEFFGGRVAIREEVARTMAAKRLSLYTRLLGRTPRKILEIGCGYAEWAPAWSDLGCKYTGVEYMPDIAEIARQRTGANIISGEFTSLDICEKFDVGFCSQVLEHVPKPRPFLSKMRDICGLIHIDVPNHDSLVSTVRKLAHPTQYGFIQPPHHLRAYTRESLKNVLERSGFEVMQCCTTRNDDEVIGQLEPPKNALERLVCTAAGVVGRGSLLVALARGRDH